MAITIYKAPLSRVGPAGQDWVWILTSTNSSQAKFKYVIDVYIFDGTTAGARTARLKISNSVFNYGSINLRHIMEQHTNTDTLASFKDSPLAAKWKGTEVEFTNGGKTMPIHLIDNFSTNNYNFRRMTLKFGEEYAASSTDPAVVYPNLKVSENYGFWNGVVPYNGQRDADGGNNNSGGVELQTEMATYGGPYHPNQAVTYFLSNAPTTQYVRDGDYMTVGTLSGRINGTLCTWDRMRVTITDPGALTYAIDMIGSRYDGSSDSAMTHAHKHLQYFGCGPANLINNSTFATPWNNGATQYTIQLHDGSTAKGREYTFIRQTDDCKNYETIRLCWLNRHGTWDYYNFTKKSYRSVEIERESAVTSRANSIFHTMKSNVHRTDNTLFVKGKQVIQANTDWVDDETSVWLEELFTSPEVYMLKGYNAGDSSTRPGTEYDYVRGVQVTDKTYERYTRANDKVAQYEITIELDDVVNVQRGGGSSLTIQ